MSLLEVILVALIVTAAAAYVARQAWRRVRRACGCGCSGPVQPRPRRATLTITAKSLR